MPTSCPLQRGRRARPVAARVAVRRYSSYGWTTSVCSPYAAEMAQQTPSSGLNT